jgi:hypothetical protein
MARLSPAPMNAEEAERRKSRTDSPRNSFEPDRACGSACRSCLMSAGSAPGGPAWPTCAGDCRVPASATSNGIAKSANRPIGLFRDVAECIKKDTLKAGWTE